VTLNYTPPPAAHVQTIPPAEAGQIALTAAAHILCLGYRGAINPEDFDETLKGALKAVGLLPVPPSQLVPLWGYAAIWTQQPQACTQLLKRP
jgi:hypothetical protein